VDIFNNRIAQAYGYAVCFITVIVMLFSIKSAVDAVFDLSDPIRAEGGGYGRLGRPITNFEVYKTSARREPPGRVTVATSPVSIAPTQRTAMADTVSDTELRRMYEAEREDAAGNARFRATRSLVGSGLLILLSAVLFVTHWRWLRKRDVLRAAAP
jgi:hypothetical protein